MSSDIEFSESGSPIYRHTPKHETWTSPVSDGEALEYLDRHYAQHFGTSMVFHELVSDLVHIDVHMCAPTAARNFSMLVTSGMSDRPMHTPPEVADRRYAELLICLPPGWPLSDEAFRDPNHYWPVRWLKTLARLPHEYDTWLGIGHTIPNGDPAEPFAPSTALCGALIASPTLFPLESLEIKVRPEKTIQLLSFIPLYNEEMTFKLKQGANALFDRLAQHGVSELLDIKRKNSCRKRFGLF